ncbi:unnamed protein product [Prunus brigantina]
MNEAKKRKKRKALTLELAQNSQMSDTHIAIWIADFRAKASAQAEEMKQILEEMITKVMDWETKLTEFVTQLEEINRKLNEKVTKLEEIYGYTELEKMDALLPSAC